MKPEINFIQSFRSKLRILEREIEKQLKTETSCCGVTMSQCHILLELISNDNISIIDLARIFELDKSTLSRTVETLVNAGFIERNINSDDRRFMRISLTEKGKTAVHAINKVCDEYYLELFKLIPEKKHDQVADCLTLLANAMKELNISSNIAVKNCCSTDILKGELK